MASTSEASVPISARVDPRIARSLKIAADRTGKSVSEIVARLLQDRLPVDVQLQAEGEAGELPAWFRQQQQDLGVLQDAVATLADQQKAIQERLDRILARLPSLDDEAA